MKEFRLPLKLGHVFEPFILVVKAEVILCMTLVSQLLSAVKEGLTHKAEGHIRVGLHSRRK